MKARLAIAIALGAALVALPASALGSSSHAATNSQSFPDSTGEDAQAPDITSVDVANDDSGNLTFKVNISNRPALTSDMILFLYLKTAGSTGDPTLGGVNYVIQLEPGAVGLFEWNGTDFVFAQSQSSLTYSYDATGATFHVSAADLGNAKGALGFIAEVDSGLVVDAQGNVDDTNAHADTAPDPGHGMFSYKLVVKVNLKQTAFTTTPAKDGQRFAASLAVTESDTSGPIASGTVSCKGIVGTTHLAATHSLRHGVATCNWKLPKTAKGKLFHGTITVVSQGATLKKVFSARVR